MEQIQIYEPNQRAKVGVLKGLLQMLQNVVDARELIWQLFRRDFLMAYKRSFLGMTWLFIAPIMGIISWVFYNYVGVLQPGFSDVPYPIYVLLSTSIWGLFIGFYNGAARTLEAGAGLLTQINFAHEAMLFKETAQHIANFSIGFLMNILMIVAFSLIEGQSYLHWQILFFPLLCFPLFLLGAGIGLFQVPLKVVLPDVSKGVGSVMGMLIFITPVIYSDKIDNPLMQSIMKYNPLTYLIGAPRDMIFYGHYTHWQGYWLASAFALLVFGLFWHMFYLVEQKLIEKMV